MKEHPYTIPTYTVTLVRDREAVMERRPVFRASEDAFNAIKPFFDSLDREAFYILMLDAKNRMIGVNRVSTGSLTSSIVHPRECFKPVIAYNDLQAAKAHEWALHELTLEQRRALERQIVEIVCRHSCVALLLAHNHPSGDPKPSQEDLHITRRLREVGDVLGCRILDHIIYGGEDEYGGPRYCSFVDEGYWEK